METDSTWARNNVTFLLNMGPGVMISDALLAMLWGSKLGVRDIWKKLQSKANQGPLGRHDISHIRGYSAVAHAGLSGCAVLSTLLRGCPGQVHRVQTWRLAMVGILLFEVIQLPGSMLGALAF